MILAGIMSTTAKPQRLEVRVTSENKRLIKRAAEIEGRSITDFVVDALASAAIQVIQDHDTLRLADRDREVFVEAMLRPPTSNQRLREASQRYRKIFS